MRLTKANIAGLTSPRQQSEMESILAGTWPPLKPLPVFKYETVEYRATIDFDKKRGEWVCRKISLPSNEVQELRGALREIAMALPHGEAEVLTQGAELQEPEQELEKDANRRLQAIHDWRESYENGARYFELRDYLSESQRTELDDSLRLSLTARQLQFNSKNVASVFDDLSIAGGRFATLIEFAKRNKAKQGTGPQAQPSGAVPEAERAIDHDQQSVGISSRESGRVPNNSNPFVRDQGAAEHCTAADEFPALSIKNVVPEQEQASLAQRTTHTESEPLEIETSEILDADSSSLAEHPHLEERRSPAFSGLTRPVRTRQSSVDPIEGCSRFPALEIPAFQIAAFALLFLFAVIAFTVGLTVGRGSQGRRLREAPKSMVASVAKPPAPPNQAGESASRTPAPPVASSGDSARTNRLDAAPSEGKSTDSTRGSEYVVEGRSMVSSSFPATESEPSAKPEVNSEHGGAIGLIVGNVPPRSNSKLTRSPKAVEPISSMPGSPAPYRLTPAIGAAARLPRPSTILVSLPGRGSQPFRVNSPIKAIAATSSFAMTSQLSVLVSPESGPVAHNPARLEAGELVSFVWPRYARPGTIRVRATIGQLGQVQEVKLLGGSASLLPATMRAVRQWRYRPTLLDTRPVQAQQDVTIEFRPPQYSSHVSTRRSSHN